MYQLCQKLQNKVNTLACLETRDSHANCVRCSSLSQSTARLRLAFSRFARSAAPHLLSSFTLRSLRSLRPTLTNFALILTNFSLILGIFALILTNFALNFTNFALVNINSSIKMIARIIKK
jgi:hypothetical protein